MGVVVSWLRSFIMKNPSWLEVSLVVDGEMAEAVSEVLARYVSGGVVIESTQIAATATGGGVMTGPLRVCGYLPIDDHLENVQQKLQEALWHLGQIRPLPKLHSRPIADLNWSVIWKEHFQPVRIGRKLVIIPTWMEVRDEQRVVVKIEPGMAFGTGTHPSTQLCLDIIADLLDAGGTGGEEVYSNRRTLIDVGCGSGILGIAALKLGVERVLGVDLDPQAVEAARQNAAINGVADRIELAVGSLAEVEAGSYSLSSGQLVVANILAPVIVKLLGEGLGEILAPQGKLILSGILEDQVPEVETALQVSGMRLVHKQQMGDWVALVAER